MGGETLNQVSHIVEHGLLLAPKPVQSCILSGSKRIDCHSRKPVILSNELVYPGNVEGVVQPVAPCHGLVVILSVSDGLHEAVTCVGHIVIHTPFIRIYRSLASWSHMLMNPAYVLVDRVVFLLI